MMMVPARAESDTVFADGDLLKITIELPFESYICIVNRELYKDGSHSEPYLIFPEKTDVGTNDKGFPGKLMFLPSDKDDDNLEVKRLNPHGEEKVGEVFTLMLSRLPIEGLAPLERSNEPRPIDKQLFERWENEWGGRVWRFEKQSSAGRSITRREKRAGPRMGSTLTDADPYPQTVYHIQRRSKDIMLFDIVLKIRN